MKINTNNITTIRKGNNNLVDLVMVYVDREYVGTCEKTAVYAMLETMGYEVVLDEYFINYEDNKTAWVQAINEDFAVAALAQTENTIVPCLKVNFIDVVNTLGNYRSFERIYTLNA